MIPTGETVKEKCGCRPECELQQERKVYGRLDTGAKSSLPPWRNEPGAIWNESHDPGECPFWDNCDGNHFLVLCPSGIPWDTNSRASNCTMKDDKTHRCWCIHGVAPKLTADKKGDTCKAGAGSIQSGNWHGFLTNGILDVKR